MHCQSNSVPDVKKGFDSTAGSVQSHLSTTNSKQRLRATASCSQNIPIRDQTPLQHREKFSGFTLFLRRVLFPAPILPHPTGNRLSHPRPWSTLCLKWALSTYCLLSLAIFSATIYSLFCGARRPISPKVYQYPSNLSHRLRYQCGHSWIDACRQVDTIRFWRNLNRAAFVENIFVATTFCGLRTLLDSP